MSIDFATAIPKWLDAHSPASASNSPGSAYAPDPEYDSLYNSGQDDALDCTQYINDVIKGATGYDIGLQVGNELATHEWDPSGHGYIISYADSGVPGYKSGAFLVENWETFFKEKDAWTDLGTEPSAGNPPSDMQAGDVILMERPDGDKTRTHAVIVMEVDEQGHPTLIAQSHANGGSSADDVSYRSWEDYAQRCNDKGWVMSGYGSLDDIQLS